MLEAVMIWNEPNNKSHWDFEIDPDWSAFGEMARLAGAGDRGREPAACRACSAASRRSIPLFIQNMQGTGRARASGRGGGARLSARLEPLDDRRVAGQARGDRERHRPAGLGLGGRRLDLRRRGGAGVRAAAHRRAADRPLAAHPLVQPVRPAARLAGDHAPSRGRGLVLLPALLHGPACARTARPSARSSTFADYTPELGICQWFHFEDHRLRRRRALAAPARRPASAHRA